MFVVYYQNKNKPKRYFNPGKGLQKTIKTAWALPDSVRKQFEDAGMKCQQINASAIAEIMYPNGVQYNKIAW